jgi:hypothetical protein
MIVVRAARGVNRGRIVDRAYQTLGRRSATAELIFLSGAAKKKAA